MSDKYPGGFVTAGAPAGFSVAFNGSSDYLTTANSLGINNFGTGDFTIECWVNFSVVGNGQFISAGSGGQANAYYWQYYSSQLQLGVQGGSSITVASWIPVANTWYHVAVTRSGTNVYQFVNGVQLGTTATSSQSFADGPTYIAYGGAGYFNGYISNARIIKGTALYTTTFTPPTQLFPITNTTLLTCQSPTFIDNSTTAATITQNGSPKVSNFTPFAGYQGFNPALGAAAGGVWTIDESAYYQQNRLWPIYDPYFNQTTLMLHGNGTNGAQNNTFLDSSSNNFTITRNGNTTQGTFTPFSQTGWSNYTSAVASNYINFTTSPGTLFQFTGDFTIECWIFPTLLGTGESLWVTNDGGSSYLAFNITTTTYDIFLNSTGVTVSITSGVNLNQWNHCAMVRSGSTITLYTNGVSKGTTTNSSTLGYANPSLNRNGGGGSPASWYMSNLRIVKGTAVYTGSTYTVPTTPLTAISGTSLLTCQSNRFLDSSSNALAATVSGTPSVQAFSPFVPAYITPTTYSNFFDGTGDYLQIASATALQLNTSVAWTIEAWVYPTTLSGDNGIIAKRSGGTTEWQFSHSSGTGLTLYTGSTTYFSGQTLTVNKFQHVAITWDLTTLRFFIDGVQTPTTNTGISLPASSTNPVNIASNTAGGETWYGCISNLRLVKGTALYTASFTPPIAPLTNITNTSLLTCQNSTFIDNSSNAFTITSYGNARPVTSPVPSAPNVDTTTLNSAYSTSLIGGSYYGAATGDYLSFTDSSNLLDMGTTAASFECWYYMTATGAYQNIFLKYGGTAGWNATNGIEYGFAINNGVPTLSYFTGGTSVATISDPTTRTVNQWYHFAIATDASNNISMYVNGVRVANATSAISKPTTRTTINIGSTAGQYVVGYLSGMRFLTGANAYNAASLNIGVPPLTPPTAISGTQMLLNCTNGAIFDNTAKNVLETVGTAAISTTQSKYGGTSMYFDGSSNLSIPNSQLFMPGSGNFTVEGWYYITSLASIQNLWGFSNGGGPVVKISMYVNTNGSLEFYLRDATPTITTPTTPAGSITTNNWIHIAGVRNGTSFTVYLNGTSAATTTATLNINGITNPFYVGYIGEAYGSKLSGYVDDFRFTKAARYLTNFTPPTSQLQDQ